MLLHIARCAKYHFFFKRENMLCLRDIDMKEHHLSQVGVLAAPQNTRLFPGFSTPSYLLTLFLGTFYLWSYDFLEWEVERINRWFATVLREELPQLEELLEDCSWPQAMLGERCLGGVLKSQWW